ncbi:hypothetical protein [Magnetospira sp. QH-2]|uniref:hypothetical protein n=1 Tax=Magnetospira sp. (strain QH-2) TaxID=1288970 RepID=UPI0003E814D3|nr:hypothetical protein [Magnetospira sp. QH-2]CCQ74313.1 Protein of unknown function [Magnetospira sp. QH-2]
MLMRTGERGREPWPYVVHHLASRAGHTYFAEVLADMEVWCGRLCLGGFQVELERVGFQIREDRDRFAAHWGDIKDLQGWSRS